MSTLITYLIHSEKRCVSFGKIHVVISGDVASEELHGNQSPEYIGDQQEQCHIEEAIEVAKYAELRKESGTFTLKERLELTRSGRIVGTARMTR